MITLQDLLNMSWHGNQCHPGEEGQICSGTAPSVGMPALVALRMLHDMLGNCAKNLDPITSGQAFAANIGETWKEPPFHLRQVQLGLRGRPEIRHIGDDKVIELEPVEAGEAPFLHPAFYMPHGQGRNLPPAVLAVWFAILHFISAMEGGERFLDDLVENGGIRLPFEQSWGFRSRVLLPTTLHQHLFSILDLIESWNENQVEDESEDVAERSARFNGLSAQDRLADHIRDVREEARRLIGGCNLDMRGEIISVDLDLTKSDVLDTPCEISAFGSVRRTPEPNCTGLPEKIMVRVAQIKPHFNFPELAARKLRASRQEIQLAMREVTAALADLRLARGANQPSHNISLVVFPEAVLPHTETKALSRTVLEIGTGILIGRMWRRLPSATGNILTTSFVNEALLAFPVITGGHVRLIRDFLIRKPLPTHVETALARHLTAISNGQVWRIIPGNRWFRFLHPQMIDFTIAICADLLDPGPWQALQGKVLHLFQPAWNTDAQLFEGLTWVRAYENFVNIVSVNHGCPGGSYSWTPKHQEQKGVVLLKGENLSLTADIALPVRELYEQQVKGKEAAINSLIQKVWQSRTAGMARYKSPPPNFATRE